jgi:hypothetical protein
MKTPTTPKTPDPAIGDIVLFKYAGHWVRGEVASIGNPRRVALRRPDAGTARLRRSVYWRNRTQLYQP